MKEERGRRPLKALRKNGRDEKRKNSVSSNIRPGGGNISIRLEGLFFLAARKKAQTLTSEKRRARRRESRQARLLKEGPQKRCASTREGD